MFKAIQTMNDSPLRERPLRVKRAIEKSKLEKKFNKVNERKMNRPGYTPPAAAGRKFQRQGYVDPEQEEQR
jgi:hypothetical protein